MRRYFLTGCTGFVGSALVRELCKRDDTESIILLTRDPQRRYHFYGLDKRILLWEGDIADCRFPEMSFTHIVHGANPTYHDPFTMDGYYEMVEGTRRILAWADGRAHFLLLSSGSAALLDNAYSQGKATAESLVMAADPFAKIARLYALVGENIHDYYAVGRFIKQAMLDRKVVVYGGEHVVRSYIDVAECARWLRIIMDVGMPAHPYAVGGDQPYSILEVSSLVADVFAVPLVRQPAEQKPMIYLPDLYDSHSLGCKNEISLRTSLERIRDKAGLRHTNLEAA